MLVKGNTWLGATCPCRCGWVADPNKEHEPTEATCVKCGAVYEYRVGAWIHKTPTFEERMKGGKHE